MSSASVNRSQACGGLEEFLPFFEQKCCEEDLDCAICHAPYKDPYFINQCGHAFCSPCLDKELKQHAECRCALCNHLYTKGHLLHDFDKQKRVGRLWDACAKQYEMQTKNPYTSACLPEPPWQRRSVIPLQESCSSQQAAKPEKLLSFHISHGGYVGRKQKIKSVCARDAVRLTQVIVKGATQSIANEIFAKKSTLHDVIARGKISLLDSLVEGEIHSVLDEFYARECVLMRRATAKGNILLVDTDFQRIDSAQGSIHCKTSLPEGLGVRGGSIAAQKGIVLENFTLAGSAESYDGEIAATNCHLRDVRAEKDVQLENSRVYGVLRCALRLMLLHRSIVEFAEVGGLAKKKRHNIILITLQGESKISRTLTIFPQKTQPPSRPLPNCLLRIQGDGIIRGNIRFKGYLGAVEMDSTVQHLGKIVQM